MSTYIVPCKTPEVFTSDLPWAVVFERAAKVMERGDAAFLCEAITKVLLGSNARQVARMLAYLDGLLQGECTLGLWIYRRIGKCPDKEEIVLVRIEWAKALSEQFKKAGL